MLFLARNTNKALCSATILTVFGCTVCNTFRDLKSAIEDAQKFERQIRKRNHAFGNESIRVRPLLSVAVVQYTLVGYSECQPSACVTSAEQLAVYLQSAKKNIVTVFHPVKAARLGGF